jgi:hypothetical protein
MRSSEPKLVPRRVIEFCEDDNWGETSLHGRYRARALLRWHLPKRVGPLLPRGARSCRNHEWYRSESAGVDSCAYCALDRATSEASTELVWRQRLRRSDGTADIPLIVGRYRARTWMRGRLPGFFTERIRKGRLECGNHEWHRYSIEEARCYHCQARRSMRVPEDQS